LKYEGTDIQKQSVSIITFVGHSVIFNIYYRRHVSPLQYVQAPKFEVDTDLLLIVDDKKMTIVSKLTPGIVPGLPNIDFTATYPQGKSRVFLFLQVCTLLQLMI
jgi:hypothetical protein